MAKRPTAKADQAPASGGTGSSPVVQIAALLAATAAAAGIGWLSGGYLNKAGPEEHAAAAAPHAAPKSAESPTAPPPSETLVPLAGITTNLAAPSNVWIRLEAAIVLDEPQDEELPDIIHQDLLAYLRTLKMHQIEGASGLQHLKADLDERAAIRSGGHVKRVLIRTLLFE